MYNEIILKLKKEDDSVKLYLGNWPYMQMHIKLIFWKNDTNKAFTLSTSCKVAFQKEPIQNILEGKELKELEKWKKERRVTMKILEN